MANVTVLGTGAMGSRMAANLLKAGHAVTVWNRSHSRTIPLAQLGATTEETPAEAVQKADFVISIVRDDDASRTVWLDRDDGALAAMLKGAIAIESSTLTVDWARKLASHCSSAGIDFLDAPVAGSRPQAEARQLIYLVGGETDALAKAKPILDAMGGTVHHAGPAGSGSAVKLMVNALLGIQAAAMGELIGFARKLGLEETRALDIVASTPACSPAARFTAGAMLAGRFDPLFPIELVEKDLSYIVRSAEAHGAEVPVSKSVRQIFEDAISHGDGDLNITAVALRYMA